MVIRDRLDRSLELISMIEAEGFSISVGEGHRESTIATIYGQTIQFGLVEQVDRVQTAMAPSGGLVDRVLKYVRATAGASRRVAAYFPSGAWVVCAMMILTLSGNLPEKFHSAPPSHGLAPPLPIYRERGHRRLATGTYESKCQSCMWACAMPVEIIVDHWNPKRRRPETFATVLFRAQSTKPGRRARFRVS